MSIRSGDRARANKQATKRRLRRQHTQLLRRSFGPARPGAKIETAVVTLEPASKMSFDSGQEKKNNGQELDMPSRRAQETDSLPKAQTVKKLESFWTWGEPM